MIHFNLFSTIGLVFDIIGAIIIILYGFPTKYKEPENNSIEWRDTPDDEIKTIIEKNRRVHNIAKTGVILLVIGFSMQLMGVNFSFF